MPLAFAERAGPGGSSHLFCRSSSTSSGRSNGEMLTSGGVSQNLLQAEKEVIGCR
jgi:hypothetical protein